MDKLEIQERILKGENLHTEFKESLPDNETLAKSIVCFANTDGGQLIIGISNSGDIVGVEDLDEAVRKIDDVAFNRCEPPISILPETVDMDGEIVLIINIPKGEQRPYRTKSGKYYIRSGNRCRQASWQEVRRLYQTSESIYYDETPISKAPLGSLDMDYFRYFLEKHLDISPEESLIESYLENLKVITHNKKPTLAGILFFGDNPQAFIPFAKIIAAYIPGKDISIPPSDRKDLEGKIPYIIDGSIKFLKLYLREEHRIKGFESELYHEIPEEVLREGIVNAIAHRDYTINASIRLFIFEDRIEIRTPGRLPNTVTIESMKIAGCHVLRNPTLYNLLYKIGMVTDTGSGVYRMIKTIKEKLNREIKLNTTETEFILSIPRTPEDANL
ncbi:putative DNA binding domain-containing protein [bacterium]|nr:putative DNA binding domain-containing protein [bacterium]